MLPFAESKDIVRQLVFAYGAPLLFDRQLVKQKL